MYFSMRDRVRTLQFNSHFNKNTTKINHPQYLRDRELCEHALCGVSEHVSLTLGANLGVLGWLDGYTLSHKYKVSGLIPETNHVSY